MNRTPFARIWKNGQKSAVNKVTTQKKAKKYRLLDNKYHSPISCPYYQSFVLPLRYENVFSYLKPQKLPLIFQLISFNTNSFSTPLFSMKKQVIIAALLFTAASSFAQIAAGTKYVGGILNFNTKTESSTLGSTTTKSPSSSSFTGSPEFGYFVADNLAVGVSLDLTSRTTTNYKADGSENAKTVSGGTGVTLYGRKFFNINENLSLFGGLNVGYTGGVTKTTAASTTTENSNFSTCKFLFHL